MIDRSEKYNLQSISRSSDILHCARGDIEGLTTECSKLLIHTTLQVYLISMRYRKRPDFQD